MASSLKALPRSISTSLLAALVIFLAVTGSLLMSYANHSPEETSTEKPRETKSEPNHFSVTISKPNGVPLVDLGLRDASGNTVTAACSTCHGRRPADHQNRSAADLKEFHQGLTLAHGRITCLSCHNSENYDHLKLSDGTAVAYSDVMQLCAQCHGPQTRDYEHGAHGGMTGYWDLSRGPRQRNNCVDCHDPHAPAFPKMNPTFKPRDRFLEVETERHE